MLSGVCTLALDLGQPYPINLQNGLNTIHLKKKRPPKLYKKPLKM
jgi:hypothetical protein